MGDLTYNEKSGWWIARYVDARGRRRRHKVSRIERDARKILSALEGQAIIDRRLGIRPLKRIRFGEFVEKFVAHAQKNVPRSWERYEDSAVNLLVFFGKEVEFTAIEPEDIEKFKDRRIEKVKAPTVNRDLQTLKRMFNLGIAWGYARENPVKRVKFFREPQGRVRYLTVDQYERVVEACRPHLRPLVIVAVHTGLRLGDLLKLRWTDIDL
jgi:integrase